MAAQGLRRRRADRSDLQPRGTRDRRRRARARRRHRGERDDLPCYGRGRRDDHEAVRVQGALLGLRVNARERAHAEGADRLGSVARALHRLPVREAILHVGRGARRDREADRRQGHARAGQGGPKRAATATSTFRPPVATDFDAEGLLDGLEGDSRDARRRLLEELEAGGGPVDELREACEEGRLALVPLERELGPPGPRFTFREMAQRANLDEVFLASLTRALGLPLLDDDEAIFTERDLEAAQSVSGFRAAGIPDDALLEVTRVLGHSLSQIVAALRSMFTQSFFSPGDSEYDVAVRWATAAKELNPILEQILRYLLRAQQVTQLRQGVFDLAGLATGTSKICVAFADLAGFTRLGEQVAADQLGSVAGRLTALATDSAQPPVRLVKMIGDAAMLVSPEPRPLLDVVLNLLRRVEEEGEEFPPLRAGIACGEGLSRGGDWFGAPVNLASRITDKARPGAVVVSSEFKDQVGEDGFNWTKLPGKRKFKGISEDQVLFRVRRADQEKPPNTTT